MLLQVSVTPYREDISWIFDDPVYPEDPTNITSFTTIPPGTTMGLDSNSTGIPANGILSQLTGRCPRIPAGIHVEIMYAEAGQHDGKALWQIVGGKVR